jgi:hypothetical protein
MEKFDEEKKMRGAVANHRFRWVNAISDEECVLRHPGARTDCK